MRKRNLFAAAYLAMGAAVAFTSCSNDEDVLNGGIETPAESGTQKIVLQVANTNGTDLVTRAGRPLLSSAAGQNIQNVKIIVCDSNGNVVWETTLDDWMSTDSHVYDNGRETTIEIPKTGDNAYRLQKDQQYTIYAFGWSNGTDYNLDAIKNAEAVFTDAEQTTPDGKHKFTENTTITLKNGVGEEIFAGSSTTTGMESGVQASVILNRQVAGSFAYVTSIPYVTTPDGKKKGEKLRMIAVQTYPSLALGKFLSQDISDPNPGASDENTTHAVENRMYVMNGAGTAKESQVLYEINLNDWFNNITDVAENEGKGDGLIDAGSNWKGKLPEGIEEGQASEYYANGSVFGGSFVIPFDKKEGKTSFVLQLTTSDDEVLRSWDVTLPNDSKQLADYDLWKWTAGTPVGSWTEIKTGSKDTNKTYNVLRNFLYGIGKRTLDKPGTNPGTDPDKPTPINNKQELELQVNDNWEVIYEMGVD